MSEKLKNLFNTKISSKTLYKIALVLFIITLIPMLVISFYNFPSADDYGYAVNIHNAWMNGDILGMIGAVFNTVLYFYFNWQGTFTAISIMSLQPSIFGVEFYFISTFVLLGFFIWGTFTLCKTVCNDFLQLDKYIYKIIAILISTICIQRIPSLVEGFYWWNGSIYYTFFFSLTLFQISHILKYFKYGKKKNYIAAILLTFMLGGSNLVTASNQVIVMTILLIGLFIKKHPKRFPMLGINLVLYITAALNMLAPGNALRQAANNKSDLITAIIDSVEAFTQNITTWWDIYTVFYVLAIILLLYKSYEKTNFSFKYPFLVTIFIFGILSALYTPPLYAMSSTGPGRLLNIVYYIHIWGLIILMYYWIGYFRTKIISNKSMKQADKIFVKKIYENCFIFLIGFGLINLMLIIGYRGNLSSYITFKSLVNGEAATYKKDMLERYDLYENPDTDVVKAKPLSVRPRALYFQDITPDKHNWINKDISKYFHKKYIYIELEG